MFKFTPLFLVCSIACSGPQFEERGSWQVSTFELDGPDGTINTQYPLVENGVTESIAFIVDDDFISFETTTVFADGSTEVDGEGPYTWSSDEERLVVDDDELDAEFFSCGAISANSLTCTVLFAGDISGMYSLSR